MWVSSVQEEYHIWQNRSYLSHHLLPPVWVELIMDWGSSSWFDDGMEKKKRKTKVLDAERKSSGLWILDKTVWYEK